jgi:hypothetical protein
MLLEEIENIVEEEAASFNTDTELDSQFDCNHVCTVAHKNFFWSVGFQVKFVAEFFFVSSTP